MTTTNPTSARDTHLYVVSFGFGHGPAPAAHVVLDLREWFRDPHLSPELRTMNGRDHPVVENVLSTGGVIAFIDRIFSALAELVHLGLGTVTVGVGCVGGRHRSPVVANQLTFRARSTGWNAEVVHRDIDRAVLPSHRTTSGVDRAAG